MENEWNQPTLEKDHVFWNLAPIGKWPKLNWITIKTVSLLNWIRPDFIRIVVFYQILVDVIRFPLYRSLTFQSEPSSRLNVVWSSHDTLWFHRPWGHRCRQAIWIYMFGEMHGLKPYEIIGFRTSIISHTPVKSDPLHGPNEEFAEAPGLEACRSDFQ